MKMGFIIVLLVTLLYLNRNTNIIPTAVGLHLTVLLRIMLQRLRIEVVVFKELKLFVLFVMGISIMSLKMDQKQQDGDIVSILYL